MINKLIKNDFILISTIIVSLIYLSSSIYKPSDSYIVAVTYNNTLYKTYNLNKNINEEIKDSGVIIEIKNGQAYIKYSDCPDSICVNSKPISKNSKIGTSIVCLPNKISVSKISPEDVEEADAVAG